MTTQKQDDKCGHLATPHGGHMERKLINATGTAYNATELLDAINDVIKRNAADRERRGEAAISPSEILVDGVYGYCADVRLFEDTQFDGSKQLVLQVY